MLYLIGIGLASEEELSIKAINILREKVDLIFFEKYTSILRDLNLDNLRKLIGKDIQIADRKLMEDGVDMILNLAKEKNVAILVPGDPLAATTHYMIIDECRKRGIKVEILHNSSIFSAIAKTGLFLYKFGKVATIPIIRENYNPESFFDVILDNLKINAHTLLLLEAESDENYVRPNEALERILKISKKRNISTINEDILAIVACRLGSKSEQIVAGKIKNLLKLDYGLPPHSIIIPAKLNPIEKEYLKAFIVDNSLD